MSYTVMAEDFLALGSQMVRQKELKKVLEFFYGESQLLNYLYNRNEQIVYPKEISRDLDLSQARVALLLNRLERENYIFRQTDPSDLRRTIVSLTETGLHESCARKKESLDCILRFIQRVDEEDCQEFLNLSKKFSDNPDF